MPKVEIDTPGVTIRLDANEASISELSKQALELYRDASQINTQQRDTAPAFGFTSERRDTPILGHGSRWNQPRTTSRNTDNSPTP